MIYIGIDPGTHTGMAVWDAESRRLLSLETLPIHQALDEAGQWAANNRGEVTIVFEDARQRSWYGSNSNAKLQGAGSVKRDCSIWEDFCRDKDIPYHAVPPAKGNTKVSAEYFKLISGWGARTSNHARDAAMLVIWR